MADRPRPKGSKGGRAQDPADPIVDRVAPRSAWVRPATVAATAAAAEVRAVRVHPARGPRIPTARRAAARALGRPGHPGRPRWRTAAGLASA